MPINKRYVLHDEDKVLLRLRSESECGALSIVDVWLEGRGLLAKDIKLMGGSHSELDWKANPDGRGGGVGLTRWGTS